MEALVHDADRLLELQALPLERKIMISQARIIEFYQHYKGNVVVSFSGWKDSTRSTPPPLPSTTSASAGTRAAAISAPMSRVKML